MSFAPSIMFGFYALLGIAFWGFIFWLAWQVLTSIRGIHTELQRIRVLLQESSPGKVGRGK